MDNGRTKILNIINHRNVCENHNVMPPSHTMAKAEGKKKKPVDSEVETLESLNIASAYLKCAYYVYNSLSFPQKLP